jgi:hypothetical protein
MDDGNNVDGVGRRQAVELIVVTCAPEIDPGIIGIVLGLNLPRAHHKVQLRLLIERNPMSSGDESCILGIAGLA